MTPFATARFALVLVALPLAAQAQAPGSCTLGTAEATLDVNDVRATVFTTGGLFYGNTSANAYFVPKDEGRSPIYAASVWVGGLVGGELRVAGSTYDNFEFWPGPLLPGGALPNPADCSGYDRIWRVSRDDVRRYLATGEATPDLAEWPVALGAPVLDGDGNPSNYDLAGGDQPAIRGDEAAFWVMNDVGNEHRNTLTPPLGLEVRVTAFAAADSNSVPVDQATLYRYELVNRSAQPMDSVYVGMFVDSDLGDAGDDFVGSDPATDLGFTYNSDNVDGNGSGTSYGTPPPAVGALVVQGPVALPDGADNDGDGETDEPGERHGMSSYSIFYKCTGCETGDPQNGVEIYHYLRARWRDGTPMREGNDGYTTNGPITRFAYPGDPVAGQFWSERNTDGQGSQNAAGDRRWMPVSGPFRLAPGAVDTFTVAFVFARGANNLSSITRLRLAARTVRFHYDVGRFEPTRVVPLPPPPPPVPEVPDRLTLIAPAPNPFTDAVAIRYELPEPMAVRLAVYDVLGREVALLADGEQAAGRYTARLDGAGLAPGVYVVRFVVPGATETFRLTKLR